MGHVLTIESDEAVQLAEELATLTGTSLDTAVLKALRAEAEAARDRKARFDKIMTMAARNRAELPPGTKPSTDMSDLYDDDGLPA